MTLSSSISTECSSMGSRAWEVRDSQSSNSESLKVLDELHARGKAVVLLSNSPSLVKHNIPRLERLGFAVAQLDGFVTSGEVALPRLAAHAWGRKCVVFGWDSARTEMLLAAADCELASLDDCEFVIAESTVEFFTRESTTCMREFFDRGEISQGVLASLRKAAQRKLPMVVLNPDIKVVGSAGEMHFLPGLLAELYRREAPDVEIRVFGKPNSDVFESALQQAQHKLPGLLKTKVCHVGDSLHHDIQGAAKFGIDSMLITTGVHRDFIHAEGVDGGIGPPEMCKVLEICEAENLKPTHVMDVVRW